VLGTRKETTQMRRILMLVLACSGLVGCATSFTGEAHVEGGPSGCEKKCESWGMDFTAMVAMGEYSDACVCRVRRPQLPAAPAPAPATPAPASSADSNDAEVVAAVTGGAAGVIMQMEHDRRTATIVTR
jgi:hypothetical protein